MSEKPYTPSTDEVRAGWITGETRDGLGVDHDDLQPGVAAEFDRWLDKVKADARREGQADAWGEGYGAGAQDMSDLRAGKLTFQTITTNPYPREADQ